jgi:hypothetical protein
MRLQRNGIILRVRLGVVALIPPRAQIVSNSEWVREITLGGEDGLALLMAWISYVVAMEFKR